MSLVSVCMIVYNHEPFLEEAIYGIIGQKTEHQIELVISNDASTDNSHEKILLATKELPENIHLKYFSHRDNLGMIGNFEFALKACSGEYIAVCEGDDYWSENEKIQRQIDFLESHPTYQVVTGNVRQFIQSSGQFIQSDRKSDYSFDYKDMIVRNHCFTCTTVIRNFVKFERDFKLFEHKGSDSQLWLRALGSSGKGMFMSDVLGVYRRHESSVTGIRDRQPGSFSRGDEYMRRKIRKAQFWNEYFGGRANHSVLRVKRKMYRKMIRFGLRKGEYVYTLNHLFKLLMVKIRLLT